MKIYHEGYVIKNCKYNYLISRGRYDLYYTYSLTDEEQNIKDDILPKIYFFRKDAEKELANLNIDGNEEFKILEVKVTYEIED